MQRNKESFLYVKGIKIPLTKKEKEEKIYNEIVGETGEFILHKLKNYRSKILTEELVDKKKDETPRPKSKLSILPVDFSPNQTSLYRKNTKPQTVETKIRQANKKFGIK